MNKNGMKSCMLALPLGCTKNVFFKSNHKKEADRHGGEPEIAKKSTRYRIVVSVSSSPE